MATAVESVSTRGLLSLLGETDVSLQQYALEQLNELVPKIWPEISESISSIEMLCEDEKFPARELASLVASKILYHLGDHQTSLKYAFEAGQLFDVFSKSEYVDTLIAKCIETYVRDRVAAYSSKTETTTDARVERIVARMFERCYADRKFKQSIGIAIECRRIDLLEESIARETKESRGELLDYAYSLCFSSINLREFRVQVLKLLTRLYQEALTKPNYFKAANVLMYLSDADHLAELLKKLLESSDDDVLLAYQIAFELSDGAPVVLMNSIIEKLPENMKHPAQNTKYSRLLSILDGSLPAQLDVKFLSTLNQTDRLMLDNAKMSADARKSIIHSALVFAHAMCQAGTTDDSFLRDNIEWMKKASNWSKLSAVAALGAIHKKDYAHAESVLTAYLPGSAGSDMYASGGALYALGLIDAGMTRHSDLFKRVFDQHQTQEPLLHGLCLGAALSSLGSRDRQLYDIIKDILYTDATNAGEAAGLALGIIMLGSADQTVVEEMLAYAKETEHEKIIRSLAVGVSFVFFGLEEAADGLITQLSLDKDPILRFGAMYSIGLAYVGTANDDAIRKLLHAAVSDVSDDVRRAAVINLGLVMVGHVDVLAVLIRLLSQSYNPHVRYGAAMALGIAGAGSGYDEAIRMLEPMLEDPVDFVRQAAYIGMSMVLQQANEIEIPAVKKLKTRIDGCINSKHEDVMAKLGAIMGMGLLNAQGNNGVISLTTPMGHLRSNAVVGTAVFSLFWYWHPFMYTISMALKSSVMVPLNGELKVPKLKVLCNGPASRFAYPPKTSNKAEKKKEDFHSVLSVTARRLHRGGRPSALERFAEQQQKKEKDKEVKDKDKTKDEVAKPPADEPQTHIIELPSRVTMRQSKVVAVSNDVFSFLSEVPPFGNMLIKGGEGADVAWPEAPAPSSAPAPAAGSAPSPAPLGTEMQTPTGPLQPPSVFDLPE